MTEKIITKEYAKTLLPQREQNSNKGTFGNILNISGSINYRGAAFLSTKSAFKIGAGYVELASIKDVIANRKKREQAFVNKYIYEEVR